MSLPNPLRFDEIVEWDNDRVCRWLNDIGIPEAQQHFRLERIDGMKLIQLGMDVSGIVHKIKELKKKKKSQELLTKYLKLFEKEVQDRACGKVPVGGSFKKMAGRGAVTSAPSRVPPPPLPQPDVVDDVEEFEEDFDEEEWEEDEEVYENTPRAVNGVPPIPSRNGELDLPPTNSAPPRPPPSRGVNGHLKQTPVSAVESDDEDDYVEPNKQQNPPTVPAWTPPPVARVPPPPPLQPSEEFYEAPNEEALPPPPPQLRPTARSVPCPPISPQQTEPQLPAHRAPAAPPTKLSSFDEQPKVPPPPPPTGRGPPQKLPPGRAGQAVPPVPPAGRVSAPQQNGRGALSPRTALPSPAVIDEPGDELYEATDTYEQNQDTHLSSNSVENDEEFYENPDDALPAISPRGPAMAGRSLPPTPPLPSGKITPQSAPAVPFAARGRQAVPPQPNAPPQVRGRNAEPPPAPQEEFYEAPDECKAPSPPPSRGRLPAPLPPPQVTGRQLPPAVRSPPPQEVDDETYEATDEYVDRPLTSPLGQGGSSRPSSFEEEMTYEATEEYIAKPMTPAPPVPSSNRQSASRPTFGSNLQTRGPPSKPPPLPDTDRGRFPPPAPPHDEEEGDTYEAMEKAPSLPPPRPGAARDVGPGNARSREPATRQNYDTPPPPVTSPRPMQQRAAIPTPAASGQDMDVARMGGVAMPGLRIGDGTLKKAKDRLVQKAASAVAPSPGSSVSAAVPSPAPTVPVVVPRGRVSVSSRPPSDPPGNEGWVPPGAPPSQPPDPDRPAPGAPIGHKQGDRLDQYPWYFGKIDRVEATELVTRLNKEGAYLVRKSEKGGEEFPYTLCVVHNREVFNIQLRKTDEDKFALGKKKPKEHIHSTVEDLIRFHQNNEIEVSKASGPCGGVRLTHCPRK